MSEIIKINDWTLTKTAESAEPLVLDIEVATKLGYKRPTDIRKLVRRMIEAGHLEGVCATVAQTSEQGGKPAAAYLLTEQQTLKVIARSKTDIADKILNEVIEVYMAWRKGQLPPSPATPSVDLSGLTAAMGQLVQVTTMLASLVTQTLSRPEPQVYDPAFPDPPASRRHLYAVPLSQATPVQPELLPDRREWYSVGELARRCDASFREVWDAYKRAGYRYAERRQSKLRGGQVIWEIREDAAKYIVSQLRRRA